LDFGTYRPWMLGLALGVAFVGGVMSIAYAGIKRPSYTRDPNTWQGFLVWCLLPLLISAVAVTTFWVWYRRTAVPVRAQLEGDFAALLPPQLSFVPIHYTVPFLAFGLVLYLTGWAIYSGYHRRLKIWVDWTRVFEFGAVVMSGLAGGLLLWLVATKLFYEPDLHYRSFTTFAAPIYLALFLLGLILFAGLSSEYTLDEDREWWARFGAWLLIAIFGWSVVSFLVLVGPQYLLYRAEEYIVPGGGLLGLLTAYLAHSAKAPPTEKQDTKGGLKAILMRNALTLGSLLFTGLLIVVLSILTNYLLALVTIVITPFFSGAARSTLLSGEWWLLMKDGLPVDSVGALGRDWNAHKQAIITSPLFLVLAFAAATLVLGMYLSRRINTNKFSYHAMYRNRLIRAYLGASRGKQRDPNPFTGFDPEDNVSMHELRPEVFHSGSFKNIGRFVTRLKKEENATYKNFLEELSPETQAHILAHDEKHHPKKVLQRALIRDLNGERFVMKSDPLLDDFEGLQAKVEAWLGAEEEVFEALPGETEEEARARVSAKKQDLRDSYAANKLRPDQLALLNRRAIEIAFPDEFHDCRRALHRPFHVVNIALNLVRGTHLAWQDRKAESFTVSPLHCGSCQIPDFEDDEDDDGQPARRPVYGSYRRSRDYGGKEDGGISLGTAVAVSGAAVSPNMGYYSSPLVTFLMTLFNVRLGWWLGNPGKAGADVYHVSNPKSSARPILEEALGLTDDENPYVYLSDGGHFENLGLYEMVLRRCNTIVVSDASDDFEFKLDNLGNAIRKIRIDFGIPIEFETMFIYPRAKGHGGAFCAVGTIEYSRVDKVRAGAGETKAPDGKLIYIKPVFYGNEPRDVYHYAQANELFPHESTVDQWFSEEQFESYRSLGMYIVGRVVGDKEDPDSIDAPPLTMDEFREIAIEHDARYKTKARSAEARLAVEQMNKLILAAATSLEQSATGENGSSQKAPARQGTP
ncbi:MAG: hypothetical protein ABR554_06565, partial [Pyrinomonadaceae bacterium]